MKKTFILLVFLFFVMPIYADDNYINFDSLMLLKSENEMRFDKQYKGKTLLIEFIYGQNPVMDSISENNNGYYSLTIWRNAGANFIFKNEDDLININKGDKIKLSGQYMGKEGGITNIFINCELVKDKKNENQ